MNPIRHWRNRRVRRVAISEELAMQPRSVERSAARRAPDTDNRVSFKTAIYTALGSCVFGGFVVLMFFAAMFMIRASKENRDTFIARTEYLCDETSVYRGKEREILPLFNESTDAEKPYEFENADKYFISKQMEDALAEYLKIHKKLPTSFRANYGAARVYEWNAYRLDYRTESIKNLVNASNYYLNALDNVHKGVPEDIVKQIELRLIDIYEDTDNFCNAMVKARELIDKYPNDAYYFDRLARLYLKNRRFSYAIKKYHELLKKWPNYNLAYTYLGSLAHMQGKWKDAEEHLSKGVNVNLPDTELAIYYEALGDSLQRLGKKQEAIKRYEDAVRRGVIQQTYKRSPINKYRLNDKPWWSVKDFEGTNENLITVKNFYRRLTSYSSILLSELRYALNMTDFIQYTWDAEYYQEGHVNGSVREVLVYDRGYKTSACKLFPQLTNLFDTFPPTRQCWKCNVKYLLISAAHIWPKCDKVNNQLTTHLALSVPNNVAIRVHNETRTWTEGDVLIFDGTFEHEIWNNGTGVLMLLSFDMWNHELAENEKLILNIF